MSFKIDNIDKKIIKRLQKNARISFREIAEELGVSESTIFVRVKKLKERNVITRFTTEISPKLVGKGLTAFILIKADPQRYTEMLETLYKIDEVYAVYDVTGNYYTIAKICVENREELAKILDKIGLIEGITSTETAIVLRTIKENLEIKI